MAVEILKLFPGTAERAEAVTRHAVPASPLSQSWPYGSLLVRRTEGAEIGGPSHIFHTSAILG
jgi:hypothetical protein